MSDDHVVPSLLISRKQPKAKGFDYAGKLPTHPECNNRFGPETYCAQALELLEVLIGEEAQLELHKVLALDSSRLPSFRPRDVAFFKLIDVRETSDNEWLSPSFFADKQRSNPMRDALIVSLSVLTKSAAALLVKRKLHFVPAEWHVYAIPHSGATEALNFEHLFGSTKPFDVGVKVWLGPLDDSDWIAIYCNNALVVYIVFVFSPHDALTRLKSIFPDADIFDFQGSSLNELLTTGWCEVRSIVCSSKPV